MLVVGALFLAPSASAQNLPSLDGAHEQIREGASRMTDAKGSKVPVSILSVAFERSPGSKIRKSVGITWAEEPAAGGRVAVFVRSVTVTYTVAPGFELASEDREAFTRELEAALVKQKPVPTREDPALLKADDDRISEFRRTATDGLMKMVERRSKGLSGRLRRALEAGSETVVVPS